MKRNLLRIINTIYITNVLQNYNIVNTLVYMLYNLHNNESLKEFTAVIIV